MRKKLKLFRIVLFLVSLGVVVACEAAETTPAVLETKSTYQHLSNRFESGQTIIEIASEQQVYASPVDEISLQISNLGTEAVGFGEAVYLEKLQQGEWYRIPYVENAAFADIGLGVRPGETYKQTLPMDMLAVQLTIGDYRIVKTFSIDSEKVVLAARFEITP